MGKLGLTLKTRYGDVSIEGDSLADFRNLLHQIGLSETDIQSIIDAVIDQIKHQDLLIRIAPIPISSSKPELSGVIEYGNDGVPHIIVSSEKLTAREVIGLLLYAKSPNAISMSELNDLVKNNWKNVDITQISANLSYMRAYIIKEGTRGSFSYRLSGAGKDWIENELLPKLRMKSTKD